MMNSNFRIQVFHFAPGKMPEVSNFVGKLWPQSETAFNLVSEIGSALYSY